MGEKIWVQQCHGGWWCHPKRYQDIGFRVWGYLKEIMYLLSFVWMCGVLTGARMKYGWYLVDVCSITMCICITDIVHVCTLYRLYRYTTACVLLLCTNCVHLYFLILFALIWASKTLESEGWLSWTLPSAYLVHQHKRHTVISPHCSRCHVDRLFWMSAFFWEESGRWLLDVISFCGYAGNGRSVVRVMLRTNQQRSRRLPMTK